MNNPIAIIITIILAVCICLIGDKRRIGGFWPFFFSFTFTPIIGLIIALSSRRKSKYEFKPKYDKHKISYLRAVFSSCIILIGILGIIGSLIPNQESDNLKGSIPLTLGFIGLGIYSLIYKPAIGIRVNKLNLSVSGADKKMDIPSQPNYNPLDNTNSFEAYDSQAIHVKLSNSIPVMLMQMTEKQKIDFLNIYLQPRHNNPYNDDFLTKFPDYNYESETNEQYLNDELNSLEFKLELNINDISFGSLNKYLLGISSTQEIFRMYAVIWAILGDRKNSDIMIKNSIHTWSIQGKKPTNYLHLVRYTQLKLFIYFEDYNSLSENIIGYIEDFNKFYIINPNCSQLNDRYQELI